MYTNIGIIQTAQLDSVNKIDSRLETLVKGLYKHIYKEKVQDEYENIHIFKSPV